VADLCGRWDGRGVEEVMQKNLSDVFTYIYDANAWQDPETRSGIGSTRLEIPKLLSTLEVERILDAGCGDWNWMSRINLQDYKISACDLVTKMIANNINAYGRQALFFVADITKDDLPEVDLILCRTVLFHLSFENIHKALRNFRSKYLLMTNHPHVVENQDMQDGGFRRLNFCAAPFLMPEPDISIRDGSGDDGYLCLWRDYEHHTG
jgi:SAM-dependent methyltransferase